VTSTSDPSEAVRLIADHDFDLIVSDLKMTPIGGMDILRRSKEKDGQDAGDSHHRVLHG